MVRKLMAAAMVLAFVAFAATVSANETILKAGEEGVCIDASWITHNISENTEAKVYFWVGRVGYNWKKSFTRVLEPGGFQANALSKKTIIKNSGPASVLVNCQRSYGGATHDWKMDAGSQKTYQPNYHMDHVQPSTYIEPGLGMPLGTERGLGGVLSEKGEIGR